MCPECVAIHMPPVSFPPEFCTALVVSVPASTSTVPVVFSETEIVAPPEPVVFSSRPAFVKDWRVKIIGEIPPVLVRSYTPLAWFCNCNPRLSPPRLVAQSCFD